MANKEHLEIIKQGVETWNAWRQAHPDIIPDLSYVNLGGTHLRYKNAQYRPAGFPDVAWQEPILQKPELQRINLSRARIYGTYFGEAQLQDANFQVAEGNGVDFRDADLQRADFSHAGIQDSNFTGANLQHAAFEGYANLLRCSFGSADLRSSRFRQAVLVSADFSHSNLQRANLRESRLEEAILTNANLRYADLRGADLSSASLVGTHLEESNLQGARIFGISAWGLHLEGAKQSGLVITPPDEPKVTVDDLEVAQFIYLLLNNEKVRHVIDTVTSKVVLILGRFTEERKAVLAAIREELRRCDLTPLLFDFDKPDSKDVTGTVETLARLARFIIADLTDPSSIPHEIATIVPFLRTTPVLPLRLVGSSGYSMFDDLQRAYTWVLKIHEYVDGASLISTLPEVIAPANDMAEKLRKTP
jgi:uncharacterized protein YjbI with pentapeptide repeats